MLRLSNEDHLIAIGMIEGDMSVREVDTTMLRLSNEDRLIAIGMIEDGRSVREVDTTMLRLSNEDRLIAIGMIEGGMSRKSDLDLMDNDTCCLLSIHKLGVGNDMKTVYRYRATQPDSESLEGKADGPTSSCCRDFSRRPGKACKERSGAEAVTAAQTERLQRILQEEMKACSEAAGRHPSNYNAWSHRIWVIQNLAKDNKKVFLDELSSMKYWVSMHVSDHSGFHYRQFLLKSLVGDPGHMLDKTASALQSTSNEHCASLPKEEEASAEIQRTVVPDLFDEELEICTELIESYPGHETLWCHRQYVFFLWHHWNHKQGAPLNSNDRPLDNSSATTGGKSAQAMDVDGMMDPNKQVYTQETKRLKRSPLQGCQDLPTEHRFITKTLTDCRNTEQAREGEPLPSQEPEGEEPLSREPEGEELPSREPEGEEPPSRESEGEPLPSREPEGEPLPSREPEGEPLPSPREGEPLPLPREGEPERPQPEREEPERPQPEREEPEHPQPEREEPERPQPEREEPERPQPEREEPEWEESVRPRPEREESVHPWPEQEESVRPRPEKGKPTGPGMKGPGGEEYRLSLPPPPAEGEQPELSLPPPPAEEEQPELSLPPPPAEGEQPELSLPPPPAEGEQPELSLPPPPAEGEQPELSLPPPPAEGEQPELSLPPPPAEGEQPELSLPPPPAEGEQPELSLPPPPAEGEQPELSLPPPSAEGEQPELSLPPSPGVPGGPASPGGPEGPELPEGPALPFPPPPAKRDELLFPPLPEEGDELLFPPLPAEGDKLLFLPLPAEGDKLLFLPPPAEGDELSLPPPPPEGGKSAQAMDVDGMMDPNKQVYTQENKLLKRGPLQGCQDLPTEHRFITKTLTDCRNTEQARFAIAYQKWLESVLGQ
ncbi:UNVERIFIED_CONTAM: hypothetical protein FKN15_059380 [Acipenser sinensis]